jgi:DNA-binding XRE family transcriptional regulator
MLTLDILSSQPNIGIPNDIPGLMPLGKNYATSLFINEEFCTAIDRIFGSMKVMVTLSVYFMWNPTYAWSLDIPEPETYPNISHPSYGKGFGIPCENSINDRICFIISSEQSFQSVDIAIPYSEHATFISMYLGLGKSDIAKILGISRPTLYAWISGESEPHVDNHKELLCRLGKMLAIHCGNSHRPLYHRFVEERLPNQDRSILELLLEKPWDEDRIKGLLFVAHQLTTERDRRLGYAHHEIGLSRQRQEANLLDNLISVDQG